MLEGLVTETGSGERNRVDVGMALLSYRRHRFPPEIIQHAIWLYLQFTLSYRDVEELLTERGLDPLGQKISPGLDRGRHASSQAAVHRGGGYALMSEPVCCRLCAGGSWIRTFGSWSGDQTVMGDGPGCLEKGAICWGTEVESHPPAGSHERTRATTPR
jgi:hypothetical protein